MRVVTKLMILGAVVLGVMLPSAASASSPVVTHLYFDGSRTISSSDYSFTNVSNVFYGTNVSHGVKVGQATLICRIVTDSTARCTGKLTIFKAGTTDTPDHSVYFTDEVLNFRSNPLVISLTGATGIWANANGGVLIVHPISATASNVELRLVY